jgi:hypothetical protein
MCEFKTILQNYGATVCRDQLAERLRRLLKPYRFDGTECHSVINAELRGPENEIAASAIRHVNVSQYHDTVPIDASRSSASCTRTENSSEIPARSGITPGIPGKQEK